MRERQRQRWRWNEIKCEQIGLKHKRDHYNASNSIIYINYFQYIFTRITQHTVDLFYNNNNNNNNTFV